MPARGRRRAVGSRKAPKGTRGKGTASEALKTLLRTATPAGRLQRMLEQAGVPDPKPEHRFARGIGRDWRFDLAWPELHLAVEIEGGIWAKPAGEGKPCILCGERKRGAHGSGAGIMRDIEKYNAAVMMGWRIYRVATSRVTWGTVREIAALIDILRAQRERPSRVYATPRPDPCLDVETPGAR